MVAGCLPSLARKKNVLTELALGRAVVNLGDCKYLALCQSISKYWNAPGSLFFGLKGLVKSLAFSLYNPFINIPKCIC